MSRLAVPTRDTAPEASRALLDAVYDRFSVVPAVFRLAASSPAVLQGFLSFSNALEGVLDLKIRLRIALAVSQVNECDYCLSANRFIALNTARIGPEEIELARRGDSADLKAAAAVRFAARVANKRGRISEDDLAAVREAGYADSEIIEIVALVVQAVFTNWLNAVAQTEVDFPLMGSADTA